MSLSHNPDDEGNWISRNVGNHSPNLTASHPHKPLIVSSIDAKTSNLTMHLHYGTTPTVTKDTKNAVWAKR